MRDRNWIRGIPALVALLAIAVPTAESAALEGREQPCPVDNVGTAQDYVLFTDCILRVIHDHDWAGLSSSDQMALAEYDTIFGNALQATTAVLLDNVIPAVPPGDIADFEFVVQNSFIREEMAALQDLLGQKLSAQRKKEAKKQAEDSVKELLKSLTEKAPWGLDSFVESLLDVINEILAVYRGGVPVASSVEMGSIRERALELGQNRPNPFNATTEISYRLAEPGRAVVRVFDLRGRLVRVLLDEVQESGDHHLRWDGKGDKGELLASGVYFYQVEAKGQSFARKSLLIK